MKHKEKQCDEVETVKKFTYHGDRVSAGGGCEVTVTAKTRCEWAKIRECGKLLHGKMIHPKQKVAVYKSYVRSVILNGSEAWCLKEMKNL